MGEGSRLVMSAGERCGKEGHTSGCGQFLILPLRVSSRNNGARGTASGATCMKILNVCGGTDCGRVRAVNHRLAPPGGGIYHSFNTR
jgi:hypothetical protein